MGGLFVVDDFMASIIHLKNDINVNFGCECYPMIINCY